jgi:hypothetical protein
MNQNPSLEIQYCWEDDILLEAEVAVTDGVFSGRTKVYVTYEELLEMGQSLIGFPSQIDDQYHHTCGIKDGYSPFDIDLFTYDHSGHTAIHISLEADYDSMIFTDRYKNRAEVVFKVEPEAINHFARELIAFGNKDRKSAVLTGIK